jgi:hypothetical protein
VKKYISVDLIDVLKEIIFFVIDYNREKFGEVSGEDWVLLFVCIDELE